MGGKGEGFTGTIIKDTWTITRGVETGEGGREGWGGGEKRQKTVLEQQQQQQKEPSGVNESKLYLSSLSDLRRIYFRCAAEF